MKTNKKREVPKRPNTIRHRFCSAEAARGLPYKEYMVREPNSDYSLLRRKLTELHYTQPFNIESGQLIEALLNDVLTAVGNFETLAQRYSVTQSLCEAVAPETRRMLANLLCVYVCVCVCVYRVHVQI